MSAKSEKKDEPAAEALPDCSALLAAVPAGAADVCLHRGPGCPFVTYRDRDGVAMLGFNYGLIYGSVADGTATVSMTILRVPKKTLDQLECTVQQGSARQD